MSLPKQSPQGALYWKVNTLNTREKTNHQMSSYEQAVGKGGKEELSFNEKRPPAESGWGRGRRLGSDGRKKRINKRQEQEGDVWGEETKVNNMQYCCMNALVMKRSEWRRNGQCIMGSPQAWTRSGSLKLHSLREQFACCASLWIWQLVARLLLARWPSNIFTTISWLIFDGLWLLQRWETLPGCTQLKGSSSN